MSVSHPLLKDLKGHLHNLIKGHEANKKITDNSANLVKFCQKLEKIFYYGMYNLSPKNTFFKKHSEPFLWMQEILDENRNFFNVSYKNGIEDVCKNKSVDTYLGKLRQFIRICLVKKCLHLPVEYLINTKKYETYYNANTILGDEILIQIFLSLLYQCSTYTFELDLKNSSFLDITWYLPDVLRIELVPSLNLGIGVRFSEDKAVIISLQPHSIAAENGNIQVGDIIQSLNGILINSSTQKTLNSILKSTKLQPVNLEIVKAIMIGKNELFLPIRKFLIDVNVNIQWVKSRNDFDGPRATSNSFGYKCNYIGSVNLGSKGDSKSVETAIKAIMQAKIFGNEYPCERVNKMSNIQIEELGITVKNGQTGEIFLEMPFTKVSSCGTTPYAPFYFGFITGDSDCIEPNTFTGHVFYHKNLKEIFAILNSMGQGFHRTHYIV